MVLRAVQRDFDGVLLGMIGAQTRAQETVNAFYIRLDGIRIAADDPPANAPAGRKIIFRQAAESHHWNIRRDGRDGELLILFAFVEYELVVNLVGKDDKIVSSRQVRQLFQHAAGADRASRIVGIDQHDGASA